MEEEGKKPTKIMVLSDPSDYGKNAIEHGKLLCQIFQSDLEIKYPERQFFNDSYYLLAEETNTILVVIGVEDKKTLSSKSDIKPLFSTKRAISFIRGSRVPVLVVGNKPPQTESYKNVVLPIDVDRQAKEKAMWASYFIRFYAKIQVNGKIHVIYNQHKEQVVARKVANNIEFVEKLYRNLELQYELHPLTETLQIDQKSIELAPKFDATLSVIMMTKFYSLIDILFGSKESQIIGKSDHFPVLCINERDDLYVLCQ
jgi:hypothetical protein